MCGGCVRRGRNASRKEQTREGPSCVLTGSIASKSGVRSLARSTEMSPMSTTKILPYRIDPSSA